MIQSFYISLLYTPTIANWPLWLCPEMPNPIYMLHISLNKYMIHPRRYTFTRLFISHCISNTAVIVCPNFTHDEFLFDTTISGCE